MMNDNEFNTLGFKIASKSPDVTPQDLQRHQAETERRELLQAQERERIYQERLHQREEATRLQNERFPARPAEAVTNITTKYELFSGAPDGSFSLMSRKVGEATHWAAAEKGKIFAQFETGKSFLNLLQAVQAIGLKQKQ